MDNAPQLIRSLFPICTMQSDSAPTIAYNNNNDDGLFLMLEWTSNIFTSDRQRKDMGHPHFSAVLQKALPCPHNFAQLHVYSHVKRRQSTQPVTI